VSDDDIMPHKWAQADYNDKGIFLVTRSGYRMTALDDEGIRRFLPRDVSNLMLGEALLDCLAASQLVPIPEHKAFFDWHDAERRWKDYEKWQFSKAGVRSGKAFGKHLMMTLAEVVGDELVILSRARTSPTNWEYPKDYLERAIRLPYASPAPQIGAALREAMNRCTGLGREAAQLPEPQPD
jgi:CDI immunity protein